MIIVPQTPITEASFDKWKCHRVDVNEEDKGKIDLYIRGDRSIEIFNPEWMVGGDITTNVYINYVTKEAYNAYIKFIESSPAPPAPPAPATLADGGPQPKKPRFEEKYLKYKSKYLKLKKLLGQM